MKEKPQTSDQNFRKCVEKKDKRVADSILMQTLCEQLINLKHKIKQRTKFQRIQRTKSQ